MDKYDAAGRVKEILNELEKLGKEAQSIVEEYFPAESGWAQAYRIFDFGTSVNPYDNTLAKLLENIHRDLEGGEYEDED